MQVATQTNEIGQFDVLFAIEYATPVAGVGGNVRHG